MALAASAVCAEAETACTVLCATLCATDGAWLRRSCFCDRVCFTSFSAPWTTPAMCPGSIFGSP
eukprot:CAMPEP_0172876386 /NCGR_PEP_ID=MMETSP1075-20121228/104174_1 /TAXON_ID=2916 /ORGANISM="Ceratium fusus, Strain PA161109" /LENGTH=63 /DNA_ID=CAMNT_0013727691 /DNA_START=40 /DNA_END=227 /DNA_ORIENTATION=-